MPPAFVLSQDQTLKFIPGPSVLTRIPWSFTPHGTLVRADGPISGPPKRSQMRKRPATRAAARASLPFPTISINKPPSHPATTGRPTTAGPRLYPHPKPPSTPLIPSESRFPKGRAAACRDGQPDAACPEAYINKFTISDQPQRAQLGQQMIRQRQLAGRRAIGRRRLRPEIAPALERPAGS